MVFHCCGGTAEDRAALDSLVQTSGLDESLKARLRAELDVAPAALTPNAYFSPEQYAALLLLLGVAGPRAATVIEIVSKAAGLSDASTRYLLMRSRELAPIASTAVGHMLNPPADTVVVAQDAVQRLRVRSDSVRPVGHIAPHFYEHPADRRALETLRGVAGFEQLARKTSEWITEREQRLQAVSSFIQVTPAQFSRLYSLWREALYRSGLSEEIGLYIENAGINARTVGVTTRQVILGSALISRLAPEELLFVMGHELGHVRSEHVLYRQVAELFDLLVSMVSDATLGIGKLVSKPMRLAMLDWYRKSEFTSDRFGLLVCQDVEAAGRTLMKLAGSPPIYDRLMKWRVFADQGASLDLEKGVDKALLMLMQLETTHPWPAVRAHQMRTWAEGGEYERLKNIDPVAMEAAVASARAMQFAMAGQLPPAPPPAVAAGAECRACGHQLEQGQRFCDACGATQF